jgi:hypothetical protein
MNLIFWARAKRVVPVPQQPLDDEGHHREDPELAAPAEAAAVIDAYKKALIEWDDLATKAVATAGVVKAVGDTAVEAMAAVVMAAAREAGARAEALYAEYVPISEENEREVQKLLERGHWWRDE